MISYNTIRHKLDLLSDSMLDVAEDMKPCYQLRKLALEFIAQAEKISTLAESLKDDPPQIPYQIDTGDHVHHMPSGATWIVAYVEDNELIPCSLPLFFAKLADCKLIYKATHEERHQLLVQMSIENKRTRGRYARKVLNIL